MEKLNEQFDQWALVELMGRQRIAGKVTERVIAGAGFLQVDVPETKLNPKFTRFIAPGSLYAINPLDEATARMFAESLQVKPIDAWDLSAFMRKVDEQRKLNAVGTPSDEEIADRMNAGEFDDDQDDDHDDN